MDEILSTSLKNEIKPSIMGVMKGCVGAFTGVQGFRCRNALVMKKRKGAPYATLAFTYRDPACRLARAVLLAGRDRSGAWPSSHAVLSSLRFFPSGNSRQTDSGVLPFLRLSQAAMAAAAAQAPVEYPQRSSFCMFCRMIRFMGAFRPPARFPQWRGEWRRQGRCRPSVP